MSRLSIRLYKILIWCVAIVENAVFVWNLYYRKSEKNRENRSLFRGSNKEN